MTDEETTVGAGSETSGEQAAETTETTSETPATDTTASETETSADNAGGAADAEQNGSEPSADTAADANESRTGFVSGARPGDECICPDGRKGTVHKFDEGLVCIPNHDQSE